MRDSSESLGFAQLCVCVCVCVCVQHARPFSYIHAPDGVAAQRATSVERLISLLSEPWISVPRAHFFSHVAYEGNVWSVDHRVSCFNLVGAHNADSKDSTVDRMEWNRIE